MGLPGLMRGSALSAVYTSIYISIVMLDLQILKKSNLTTIARPAHMSYGYNLFAGCLDLLDTNL